jgi:hypothetical protein
MDETTRQTDEERPHGDPLREEWRRYGHDPLEEDPYDFGPPPPRRRGALDFSAFFVLLDALRRAAPRELQSQFNSFIREGLLTLRSLIDWYLERLDRPPKEPRVEDIPID